MAPIRAALYVRVSTDEQTIENQVQALSATASQRGWPVTQVYSDVGISGAKGRDKRPGLDAMLKDCTRGKFNVLLVWSVDRLGRSLRDLVDTLAELQGSKAALFVHQQALDTTTPAGQAMFGMLGIFAEFERSIIQARIRAGLDRRRREGRSLGRARVGREKDPEVRKARRVALATAETVLRGGGSINQAIRDSGLGSGTVQRLKASMAPAP